MLVSDQKCGVKIVPSKEASWASVRDKALNGELDFAHLLYGLVYGLHLGIGGPKRRTYCSADGRPEQQRSGHHPVQSAG